MKKASVRHFSVILSIVIIIATSTVSYALGTHTAMRKTETSETEQKNAVKEDKKISEDETVYVLARANGSIKKIIVSDWIKNAVSGKKKYALNGDNMTVWDAEGNDICYQGDIQKELPVSLTVTYKLNGKSVTAKEIAGKSGKVTIRFDYDNRQYETVKIDGKSEKIYVPFTMLTAVQLDNNAFKNIRVSNGKTLNEGDSTAVIGFALPGLQHNLGISKNKHNIPDFVEITADASNFKLGMTVTVATNELFNKTDASKFNKLDSIADSADKLTNGVKQLLDGSSALYYGLDILLKKSDILIAGINRIADGTKTLKDASVSIGNDASSLKGRINELANNLKALQNNNAELNKGAKEVFGTLLSKATTQLKNDGFTVPELTKDNYAEVLDEIIESLDETKVYNEILAQVTSDVEQNRPFIEKEVTQEVRNKITEKVIGVLDDGTMNKEVFRDALTKNWLPPETKNMIDSEVNLKMESDVVKAEISEEVQDQIGKRILAKMESEEVKAKLKASSEKESTIVSLKTSIDDYNKFYNNLTKYTKGVSTATDSTKKLSTCAKQLKDKTSGLEDKTSKLDDDISDLKDGVAQFKDDTTQLSNEIKVFNNEDISKITQFLNENIKSFAVRMKATADVSASYRNFSETSDKTDGKVKFIYKTDEILSK